MAALDFAERQPQDGDVEGTAQLEGAAHVVGGASGMELGLDPHPLLGEGEGHPSPVARHR